MSDAATVPRSAHASGTLDEAVGVLLDRGARAQTEVSGWTPHRSRDIIDLL